MTIRTRFAPSPTGHLHVGNLRTAIHNWLWARKMGGEFWLRLDDTDAERSREEYVAGIIEDLAWLGMSPVGQVRQSDRFAIYEARFTELQAAGRVYPCFESAQELDLKRKVALGRGLPPVYDRAALALSADEIAAKISAGEQPHWRFRLDHAESIGWADLVRGPVQFEAKLLSDPVIRRADGSWLYMLPSVIDDMEMGISHVVRGEDHVSNTAAQVQMFTALGARPPAFAHAALLTGSEGKLSKRLGSLGISAFREQGLEPAALIALLARLGTSLPVEPVADVDMLAATLDFARFGRAPARFDEQELAALNEKMVHQLPFAAVAPRLPQGMDEAAWLAIRPNLATVSGAGEWWAVVSGDLPAPALGQEDRAYCAQARAALVELPFGAETWKAWTETLKAETGRKGKPLFLPLRLALTAREHGPDMAALLPLIGRERALARLAAAAG